MSTVAWDGKNLASDSHSSDEEDEKSRQEASRRLFIAHPDVTWYINNVEIAAFGLCGDTLLAQRIKQELAKGVTVDTVMDDLDASFQLLAVGKNGEVLCWDYKSGEHATNTNIFIVTGPYAIGSGAVLADAVMSIGKPAEDAVKAAIKYDSHTGGRVQVWEAWKGKVVHWREDEPVTATLSNLISDMRDILNTAVSSDEEIRTQLNDLRELLQNEEYAEFL